MKTQIQVSCKNVILKQDLNIENRFALEIVCERRLSLGRSERDVND